MSAPSDVEFYEFNNAQYKRDRPNESVAVAGDSGIRVPGITRFGETRKLVSTDLLGEMRCWLSEQ